MYLIYCRTGRRSAGALDMMAELGFREVYNMVGGVASIFGPAIGAGILTILSEQLFAAGYYRTLIFGGLLLVVIVFLPGGLVSLPLFLRRLVSLFRKRR